MHILNDFALQNTSETAILDAEYPEDLIFQGLGPEVTSLTPLMAPSVGDFGLMAPGVGFPMLWGI